jgi:hypothetical protein
LKFFLKKNLIKEGFKGDPSLAPSSLFYEVQIFIGPAPGSNRIVFGGGGVVVGVSLVVYDTQRVFEIYPPGITVKIGKTK